MLVLKRKPGERILLTDGVVITFVEYTQRGVKIGIEAPDTIGIIREEIASDEIRRSIDALRAGNRRA